MREAVREARAGVLGVGGGKGEGRGLKVGVAGAVGRGGVMVGEGVPVRPGGVGVGGAEALEEAGSLGREEGLPVAAGVGEEGGEAVEVLLLLPPTRAAAPPDAVLLPLAVGRRGEGLSVRGPVGEAVLRSRREGVGWGVAAAVGLRVGEGVSALGVALLQRVGSGPLGEGREEAVTAPCQSLLVD